MTSAMVKVCSTVRTRKSVRTTNTMEHGVKVFVKAGVSATTITRTYTLATGKQVNVTVKANSSPEKATNTRDNGSRT